MDLAMIISSLGGLTDLVGGLVKERDAQKAAALEIEFTKKISEVQIQLSQVLGAVIEKDRLIQTLSQTVRELEARESEKARYELAKLGALGNALAYRLRPPAELQERVNELPHFLCHVCFNQGKKSILDIHESIALCPVCKNGWRLKPDDPPSIVPVHSGMGRARMRDW